MSQVASALHAAHEEKGLVHRDVKPANILVVSGHGAEGGDHVYLSDFGIAKQRAAGALTKTGMFVGTADYAAPEQIEGRELDRRADVYALGCVLYETLTGAPTYEKDSEVALMYAHLLEPPPQVTHKRPDLSPRSTPWSPRPWRSHRRPLRDDPRVRHGDAQGADRYGLAPDAAGRSAARVRDRPHRRRGRPPPRRRPSLHHRLAAGSAPRGARRGRPEAKEVAPAGRDHPAPPDRGRHRRRHPRPHRRVELEQDRRLAPGSPRAHRSRTPARRRDPEGKAIETDVCTPSANATAAFPDNLTLSFYSSGEDVLKVYDDEVSTSGVTVDSGRCDRSQWKGEGTKRDHYGKLGGRRPCFVDGNGDAIVAWTHEKKGFPEPRGHVRARQGARTWQHSEPVQLVEPVPPADREVPRAGLRGLLHGHDQQDHRPVRRRTLDTRLAQNVLPAHEGRAARGQACRRGRPVGNRSDKPPDITIEDPLISRRHAIVRANRLAALQEIEDLGSLERDCRRRARSLKRGRAVCSRGT